MVCKSLPIFILILLHGGLLLPHVAMGKRDPVIVSGSVDFKAGVSPHHWNAIFIDLKANHNPHPEARNHQYVDNVKVVLTLGYELGSQQFSFYQAEVTLVTLQQNDKKRVIFFIPREIVERDNLANEPKYWTIDLAVDGDKLPMRQARCSSTIANAEQLNFFKRAYTSGITQTSGILVPAHLSPYGYGFGAGREPPAVIWKPSN